MWRLFFLFVFGLTRAELNPTNPCAPCTTCTSFAKELNVYDMTWTTSDYNDICITPKIILIHDTVSNGGLETIQALHVEKLSVQYIVDQKGAIFQQVADVHRAWHAGYGSWRDVTDVNTHSVGIEVVNSGWDPYPAAQLQGLFDTRLTPAEQKKILVDGSIGSASEIGTVQADLERYGYNYLKMEKGKWDQNTQLNMEAFNRHFVPEVFELEKDGKRNPDNKRWYQLSQERLQKLLK
ncbi:hypothetical protein WR25_09548 [Diploscapter pachys]|uniref:N-acetylmuramoyl-L-alanine amidase n=1 Tax=Diploscapter pachys TaxID=2018661 RepID=A0A2A2KX31_9BILA|nr:hypothetical protein WR25_09548 [Diploscapter pachys]